MSSDGRRDGNGTSSRVERKGRESSPVESKGRTRASEGRKRRAREGGRKNEFEAGWEEGGSWERVDGRGTSASLFCS